MKRHKFLWIMLGILLFALPAQRIAAVQNSDTRYITSALLTATPTAQVFPQPELNTQETQAVIKTLQAYFEARYQALSALRLDGFEPLLSNSGEAKTFWEREAKKLRVEIEHARMNQLRYVDYRFSLNYLSLEIDPRGQRATIVLEENSEVVYELSAKIDPEGPVVSRHGGIVHTIQLVKEDGHWKILSDTYTDYLWRIFRQGNITPEELLARMKPAPLPSGQRPQAESPCNLVPDESTHPYDREGAVSYALKYAVNPNNLNYHYFSEDEQLGGDCTNFVSQAIYEGGKASMSIPPTPQQGVGGTEWYYFDVNNRARAWTWVDGLYDFITHPYAFPEGPEGCEVSIDQIDIGDVIQYETDGDNVWDHAVIVVEIQDGIPYVASHSPNFEREAYNYFAYNDIRFLHIERLDIRAPRGF